MKIEKEYIDELIISYLNKELDNKGMEKLKIWITASIDNENYFMQMRELWFSAMVGEQKTRYDKNRAFDRFREEIHAKNRENTERKHDKGSRISHLWRYAGVVALLLSVSLFYLYWGGHVNRNMADADVIVEVPLGSKTKLSLPDGSLVWLNAGSRMVYSRGFGVENRRIELNGEGYFEVKRNEKLPFHVETKNLEVMVLGTKFNVRDYPDEMKAIISLSQGKVRLNDLRQKDYVTFLLPDQRAIFDKQTKGMKVEKVIGKNVMQWTNGYLFFDEELLPTVVKELERSYNVKIQIKSDSLKIFRFYGAFNQQEQKIEEIVDVLSSTKRIKAVTNGRNITLY